jgi:DNA-binding NarL/FixJ family response regulator
LVQTCIVILSGHSLLAEGVASRLRQHLNQCTFRFIDPRQPDAMVQIAAARPSAVILDVTDPEIDRIGILSRLQLALSGLKIICLDPRQEQITVVTSRQQRAAEVRDVIEVLNDST